MVSSRKGRGKRTKQATLQEQQQQQGAAAGRPGPGPQSQKHLLQPPPDNPHFRCCDGLGRHDGRTLTRAAFDKLEAAQTPFILVRGPAAGSPAHAPP